MVEFDSLDEIRRRYGPDGLAGFPAEGGRITDDTQMTLFTAEALDPGPAALRGPAFDYAVDELWAGYRRWLDTQQGRPATATRAGASSPSPSCSTAAGPGNTCLSALIGNEPGFVELPVNDSKGCGGVMRVAPVGLVAPRPCGLGIASAALTHGHPSGYLAAGAAAEDHRPAPGRQALRPAVEAALEAVSSWPGHEETVAALGQALTLADREPVPTPEAVGHARRRLGRRGGPGHRRLLRPDR